MTLERAITDYKAKTPRSRQLFEEALRVMPGGNSRTTTFFDPYPFYITRGEGAHRESCSCQPTGHDVTSYG